MFNRHQIKVHKTRIHQTLQAELIQALTNHYKIHRLLASLNRAIVLQVLAKAYQYKRA